MQYEISELEVKGRQMLSDYLERAGFSETTTLVIVTFKAKWSSALPLADIIRIGSALLGIEEASVKPERVKKVLNKMVRASVLRSRVENKKRLWELKI